MKTTQINVKAVSIVCLLSSSALAGLIDKYPTSIDNPQEFVSIRMPGGQVLGNCSENLGAGAYEEVERVEYYGDVPHPEKFTRFRCTVELLKLKQPAVSIWWTPVFNTSGELGTQFKGRGVVVGASFGADIYGPNAGNRLVMSLTGTCRHTLPPSRYWNSVSAEFQLCDRAEFVESVERESRKIPEVFLRQTLDKTVGQRYPCVGSSFPGACTETAPGPYGECLSYGPPTHIPAGSYADCAPVR